MTYFLGNYGKVKLNRKSSTSFRSSIIAADVNTSLNRVGIDGAAENLITGDRIELKTDDNRGLDFLPAATWADGGGSTLDKYVAFANVNKLGGVRLFSTFSHAVNNVRVSEIAMETFAGAALPVDVRVYGSVERVLGDVTGFAFNTDREALDATSMSDKFKRMFSAGLISGSGSIDCLFNLDNSGLTENSLLMLQLINRADIGSEFSCFLQLIESTIYPGKNDVYYEFDAMITRSGIEVRSDQTINCVFDFVTTGDIRLVIGRPSGYLLKEDEDRIRLQQDLNYLLTEAVD